jgi:hypothetical protein
LRADARDGVRGGVVHEIRPCVVNHGFHRHF